jgi:hypothetical protein
MSYISFTHFNDHSSILYLLYHIFCYEMARSCPRRTSHTSILPSFVAPIAEGLYTELIDRVGPARVDLLGLTAQQRRQYIDTQWPQGAEDQKRLISNMYPSIVDYLDIDAVFDPPAVCTPDQLVHCQEICYNLQTSFVLAVDAYINIRIRYRQGIKADPAFRMPAPYTTKVENMQAAGYAFFDYSMRMSEPPTFPKFPS